MQHLRARLDALYARIRAREATIAASAFICGAIVATITVSSLRSAALRDARSDIKELEKRLDVTIVALSAARSASLDKEHLASQLAAEKKARGEADIQVANLRAALAARSRPQKKPPDAARGTDQRSSGRKGVNRTPDVPPLFAGEHAARDRFGGLNDSQQFQVFVEVMRINTENIAAAESEAGGVGGEFHEILGDLNSQIYAKVAKKYEITEDHVTEIVLRGTREGWAKRMKAASKR